MARSKTKKRGWVAKLFLGLAIVVAGIAAIIAFSSNEKQIREDIPRIYSLDDPQFVRTLGVALGPPIVGGNRFRALQNGEEIFPAMLAAIRGAKKTISFETYIYWSGDIGRQFANALSERAKAGIKVHVLIDWLGSAKIDKKFVDEMKASGVDLQMFHPLDWWSIRRFNNRTHRKLLIIDGRIGFTGGVGIADQWTGHAQDTEHWRDSHYMVEGPAAANMQATFMDNWIKVTGAVLHGEDYYPEIPAVGNGAAQVFSSSPSGGAESMKLMYLLAITAAKRSINLSSAYFVPDELSRDALVAAMKRGVRVRIITPGPNTDQETVRRASRALWGELLEAGVEIYEFVPTMYHCKIMIVDDRFVSVGSTNFDPRSFHLNDEANLNVIDKDFALQQNATFEKDIALSRKVTYEQWKNRPFTSKVWEHGAALLGPLL